jgi:cytochrome bd-type quinol oxidase subunit 1
MSMSDQDWLAAAFKASQLTSHLAKATAWCEQERGRSAWVLREASTQKGMRIASGYGRIRDDVMITSGRCYDIVRTLS